MSIAAKNILLTGGRAPAALDLARQCARNGHRIICAESIPVHLCRYSRLIQQNYLVPAPNREPDAYIDALIQIIQREKIDLVLPTCEEIFFIARGLERLRKYCTVFVSPLACMRQLHSKWEFIQLARQHGFQVPETHLLNSQADLQHFLAQYTAAFVLKPVFSRFATNVILLENTHKAKKDLGRITISEAAPWIAQERISGIAYSTYSVACHGKVVAHTVYAENFTAGRGACIHFTAAEQPAIDQWVERFVQLTQFSGQIAFDLIVTADGKIWPLECNPRATSGVHLFQSDEHLDRAFLSDVHDENQVLKPDPSTRKMIALAMLLFGLTSVHSWSRYKVWQHIFFGSHDVIFDAHDMRPFLNQWRILWYNWQGSRKTQTSLLAFSTYDIEWNGQN